MSKQSRRLALILLVVVSAGIYFGLGKVASTSDYQFASSTHRVTLLLPIHFNSLPPPAAGHELQTKPGIPSKSAGLTPGPMTDEYSQPVSNARPLYHSGSAANIAQNGSARMESDWSSWKQCEDQPEGFNDYSPAMLQVYSDFIPAGVSTRCSRKKKLVLENREVYFVYITYGDLRGCDSHCYSSQLCAVSDGQKSYLFSAQWFNYEAPISLADECPELADKETGNTNRSCRPKPSGYHHPAISTANIFALYSSTAANVFRNCFR